MPIETDYPYHWITGKIGGHLLWPLNLISLILYMFPWSHGTGIWIANHVNKKPVKVYSSDVSTIQIPTVHLSSLSQGWTYERTTFLCSHRTWTLFYYPQYFCVIQVWEFKWCLKQMVAIKTVFKDCWVKQAMMTLLGMAEHRFSNVFSMSTKDLSYLLAGETSQERGFWWAERRLWST